MGYLAQIFATVRAWRRGQSMMEYALIVGLIAVVASVGYFKLGIKGIKGVVKSDYQAIKAVKIPKTK
jgi:Flp pilus assembly pilin Flp